MIFFENINEVDLSGSELKNYRRKKKVLHLLYHHNTLSATSIGKKLGVSLPTAIALLKELGSDDLVELRGIGKSKGGRKPMLFGLKSDSIFVVACELGRFNGKIGIYDAHNQLVAPIVMVETNIDDSEMEDKLFQAANKIIEENQLDSDRVYGVGLAMPGLVDAKYGINYTIKDKALQNVKKRIQAKFNRLVAVNNDARMQAYGEYIFGEAVGHSNALIINWNWGLGLGMILDDKLYNGTMGFAGELSHIKFVEDGELCICGKRGCLETVTSVYVILEKAREAIRAGRVSQLTQKFKDREDELRIEDIIYAIKKGDEFSISLINTVGLQLGKALSNTIQLLNPDIIVVGGVVSEANQYILTSIQQAVNQYCLEQISSNTKIVVSKTWKHSGLLGVTAILFQKLFSNMKK
uniref:ROK family transcriptional regulator n=1 Tax=uncultured Draconibacterium sp. TaxID=1573823 RepID=UPI003216EDD6